MFLFHHHSNQVVIRSGEINKSRFSRGTHVKYRFMQEPDHTATPVVKDTLSPEWKHSRVVSIPAVDQTHLDFFDSQSISFQIYGQQVDSDPDPNLTKLTTKVRFLSLKFLFQDRTF